MRKNDKIKIGSKDVNLFDVVITPETTGKDDKGHYDVEVHGIEKFLNRKHYDMLSMDNSVSDMTLHVDGLKNIQLFGIVTLFDKNDGILDEQEFEYKIVGKGKKNLLKKISELVD